MTDRLLAVDAVTEYLQTLLDADDLLANLWVQGEVTESFTSRAGHVYLTLSGDESLLKCVMFRGAAVRQRYVPMIGESCVAHGSVSIYKKSGAYQLYVDVLQPAGAGINALQYELLRQLLESEGLFDPARKRPIPDRPTRIGVVTSPDGAVWHDILSVVERRNPFVELVLSPAAVQGEQAPASLVSALKRLTDDSKVDVIIIARGGGSAADLSAFNDEALARAVFASPTPIVSAIGHETDVSLVDDVADVRAPTPSVAAELCAPHAIERYQLLGTSLSYQRRVLRRQIAENLQSVDSLRDNLLELGVFETVQRAQSTLVDRERSLLNVTTDLLDSRERMLTHAPADLQNGVRRSIDERRISLTRLRSSLDALDPTATLARGYARVTKVGDGTSVKFVSDVVAGERIGVHLYDGSVTAAVEGANKNNDG